MSYQQSIYNRLRKNGITEAAALGMIGNLWCESNCEPYRLQGDFSSYKTVSKDYVRRAENGTMSEAEFCKAVGFGIAQWTYPARKANLWVFWKASGQALDSVEMQTDFILHELRNEYKALYEFLRNTNDTFTATSRICREYERPAVNNIDARFQAANRIKYEIDLNAWNCGDTPEPAPQPTPTPQPQEDHALKLRTIDKHCSSFTEVYLLKALLINRGYDSANGGLLAVDDIWTEALTDAAVQFQKDFGLDPDGVIGPASWAKLTERG